MILVKPWAEWTGTCSRCLGPFTEACVGRRCRSVRLIVPYECALCGQGVTTAGPRPPESDDDAWKLMLVQHLPSCLWVVTRGYQRAG